MAKRLSKEQREMLQARWGEVVQAVLHLKKWFSGYAGSQYLRTAKSLRFEAAEETEAEDAGKPVAALLVDGFFVIPLRPDSPSVSGDIPDNEVILPEKDGWMISVSMT